MPRDQQKLIQPGGRMAIARVLVRLTHDGPLRHPPIHGPEALLRDFRVRAVLLIRDLCGQVLDLLAEVANHLIKRKNRLLSLS